MPPAFAVTLPTVPVPESVPPTLIVTCEASVPFATSVPPLTVAPTVKVVYPPSTQAPGPSMVSVWKS